MISKTCGIGLLIGVAAVLAAVPVMSALSAPLDPPAVIQVQVTGTPVQAPDLQKQVDDALKELDKLDKILPDQPEQIKRQLDDVRQQVRRQLLQVPGANGGLIVGQPGVAFGGGGIMRATNSGQGRWGVTLQRPTPVLVDQLKLPAGQGLVVADVLPDSPSAKAGILKNDILLEVDGKAVASDLAAFNKEAREIKANAEVNVSVLRRGQKETIKGLKLPEAKAEAGGNLQIQQFQIQPGQIPNVQFPKVPNIQIVPPAGFPGALPGGLPGGFPGGAPAGGVIQLQGNANANGNESMTVQINNDEFAIGFSSGTLKATVKGKRDNGKSTASEINIEDGDTKVSARTMDQVPERYRATIARMLSNVK